jgi:hypothetical protein
MSCNKIHITNNCDNIVIPQPITNVVKINTPGPQGPVGPQGPPGAAGGDTGSFATTGSNIFRGNQTITGSIIFNSGSQITSTYYGNNYPGYIDIVAGAPGGFVELLSYNQSSSFVVEDYGVYITTNSSSLFNLWEFRNDGRLLAPKGIEAPSFTGSLQGSSSYALTASYAMNGGGGGNVNTSSLVTTASFNQYTSSVTSQFAGTSSFALTASYALTTAGTITNALTASYITSSFFTGNNAALSASYALTASYAMNGGGSGTPGGSNTQIQFNANNAFSGSPNFTFNSGSNILTLTGSLNITGSTTQIGNNIVQGNTLLSGSITISGSSGPGAITASVQIYGDIRQSGYHRFDPVSSNIDNSISASYIYVSGSTQDLYFSQNGSGYSNTTRLRWLEGGSLYTGLLRGGVISSTPGTTTFKITSGSGLLVTMNASTASEPYPIVQYISWPDYNAQPIQYSGSAQITYVGIKSDGTIQQQTVPWGTNDINQWDNSITLGVVLTLSGSVSTGVFNAPQIAYGGFQKTDDFFRAFGPLKTSGHTLRASGSSPTLSIIKDAGTSYREGANYTINANHPSTVVENSINVSKIFRYRISGSTPVIDTGVGNAGYTDIDNDKYVNTTTGQLASVGGAYWSIQRVFWVPNSPTNAFIVYYGNDRYRSLVDATNAKDSEPFIEAPNTAQNAIFLGYIIIQGGGSGTPARDLLNASEATIIPAGLFRNVGGIGSSGTNFVSTTLAGLADVSLSSNTPGDLLVYGTGTTWNNKKQLTGSYSLTGSLTVTQNISASSFTGSLQGTASWASNALTASYVTSSVIVGTVLSASYALTASYITSSFFTGNNAALSSSYAVTASYAPSYVLNSQTSSFATTGSNIFKAGQTISGSLLITGSTTITGSLIVTSGITGSFTGSLIGSLQGTASWASNALTASYITSSFFTGNNAALSASYALTASSALSASYTLGSIYTSTNLALSASNTLTASYINPLFISSSAASYGFGSGGSGGSFVTSSWTGSTTSQFSGTSSFALTASYALTTAGTITNALTASYITSSFFTGNNAALSASYALTASFASNGGVTQITAGSGISINQATSNVTITSTGGGGISQGKVVAITTGYSNLF